MNTPNKLTVLRIILIPLMVLLLYVVPGHGGLLAGAAVFAAASFTDYLDGHLARKLNLVTDFGKFLDPVADKLLVLSAFIMMVSRTLLPAWAVIAILTRELMVDGLRMIAVGKGKVIAAGKLGKIKTVSQMMLLMWVMVTGIGMPNWFTTIGLLWVVVITIWSGVDYFIKNGSFLLEEK